jgi:hypothetical protein
MEPEGSLPSLQELSTCTYPEPDVIPVIIVIKFGPRIHNLGDAQTHSHRKHGNSISLLLKNGVFWVVTPCGSRRKNPEDTILHSHRRENLKSYKAYFYFSM